MASECIRSAIQNSVRCKEYLFYAFPFWQVISPLSDPPGCLTWYIFFPPSDEDAESRSCPVMKVEGGESDEEPSAGWIELSSSPTYSDVSISRWVLDKRHILVHLERMTPSFWLDDEGRRYKNKLKWELKSSFHIMTAFNNLLFQTILIYLFFLNRRTQGMFQLLRQAKRSCMQYTYFHPGRVCLICFEKALLPPVTLCSLMTIFRITSISKLFDSVCEYLFSFSLIKRRLTACLQHPRPVMKSYFLLFINLF